MFGLNRLNIYTRNTNLANFFQPVLEGLLKNRWGIVQLMQKGLERSNFEVRVEFFRCFILLSIQVEIEWIPCNKKIIHSPPGLKFKSSPEEYYGNSVQVLEMDGNFDQSIAFKAACELVFEGKVQPSGYTEPILHKKRF